MKLLLTEGCPNGCAYCYEPQKKFIEHELPDPFPLESEIIDMNFLARQNPLQDLLLIPKGKHQFICGVDYRRITTEIAYTMREKGFIKVRWAWDGLFSQQKIHQRILRKFLHAGYKPSSLMVFMLVNWKIPYVECVKKLELLKIWNVQVSDCCFDGGYKRAAPGFWTDSQRKRFKGMCRKHNQLVRHGIDPEFGKGWGWLEKMKGC